MLPCPACQGALVDFEPEHGAPVQLCTSCRGLLVAPATLAHLTGAQELESLSEGRGELGGFGRCPSCGTRAWSCRRVLGSHQAGLGVCGCCGSVWLLAGELSRLQEQARLARRPPTLLHPQENPRVPPTDPTPGQPPTLPSSSPLPTTTQQPFDRVPFDRGLANVLGVPAVLLLSLIVCSGSLGRVLAALVGMPFHELGHALASWLGSRLAIPLPFFTIWLQDQSWWFGLLVASLLSWFGVHSWRERRLFGVGVAATLLASQLLVSWILPTRSSEMIQILAGAWGEIVLGALILAAFHFPLPDRLRWDFWRWPLLLPAALCFVQAALTWLQAIDDVSHMPWGSAIGSASDGDMNRLVRDFGWSARGLARFYLNSVWIACGAITAAHVQAWRRYRHAQRSG